MLKNWSLRARLTLLSALVTGGVAVVLTCVSLLSADRIFVQDLRQELLSFEVVESAVPRSAEVDAGETGLPIRISLSRAGRRFNLWGVAGMVLVTLLGTGATWLMAGRALAPVRELSEAIGQMGGDLSRRVDTRGRRDEIGQLAASFNAMMDKVRDSFERQKRFSASAAHELKTPLATIQVGLEVLELDEHPSPARMEKALAVAKTNTRRMIELVENLFRLSADEAYEMADDIAVGALFSEIVAELSPTIGERQVHVSSHAPPGLALTGNRVMLYRALFNLAENAVKYNREGGTVSLSASGGDGGVTVCVRDTGIGIAQEDLEHIFEPFYRADRSRSRAMGGSGLGLSLVWDIVEKHHGEIHVESRPGKGTEFVLRLPEG